MAFGTGGLEGDPPLMEGIFQRANFVSCLTLSTIELGINFGHIRVKSMTVLNPLRGVDERIMDDADLAGPVIFILCFGISLLFVRL